MKTILVVFTVLTVIHTSTFFMPVNDFKKAYVHLQFNYHLQAILLFIQLLVQATFIHKVWKNDIPQKRKKWENTLMIVFLGVIGMWFLIVEWQKQERSKPTTFLKS